MAFLMELHGSAMTLRQFLALQKSNTKVGKWSDKKMAKTGSGFPSSKTKGLRVGGGWHWVTIELEAGIAECRLLVAYHPTKQNYLAVLGYVVGNDTHVIASLEYDCQQRFKTDTVFVKSAI